MKIKDSGTRIATRQVMLSEGKNIGALFKQELRDQVPKICIASFLYFAIVAVPLLLLATALISYLADSETVGLVCVRVIIGLVIVQGASCLLGMLPLSRFWLPRFLNRIVDFFINLGNVAMDYLYNFSFWRYIGFLSLIVIYIVWAIAWSIYTLFFRPVYWVLYLFTRKVETRSKVTEVDYYAGLAEWYIDKLMRSKPDKLSDSEVLDLAYLHTELVG